MYGLIGKKLGHSFSADFFNKKFAEEGIPETYRLFQLQSITDFPSLILQYPELKGLNVTLPYKQDVMLFLDHISPEASGIGAVNVVKIKWGKDIILTGFNTDYIGFRDSLIPLLNNEIKKALILGTGGASKAVAYVLKNLDIDFTFVSRNPSDGQLSYQDLTPEIISQNLLIVNTTPLGMWPDVDSCPPIPYDALTSRHVCYDLVYNPETTSFMKLASQKGAITKNGLEMLHLQALAAWDIWTS